MLPDMSVPYKASGKISHRGWFSLEEYTRLYKATGDRADKPKKERWRHECETLHDFVLIMANTGLRPDEALRLELRDVETVADEATGKTILEIEVRGKRGVGSCKSMPGAVHPFERLIERRTKLHKAGVEAVDGREAAEKAELDPTTKLFPSLQRELFNDILKELNLKRTARGNLAPSTACGTPPSAFG